MERFGLVVHPKAGILIIPFYGYLKQLFEGNYKEIPNYLEFLQKIVIESHIIPPFITRQIIENNSVRTLKIFKEGYTNVKQMDDVYNIFENSDNNLMKGLPIATSLFE